MSELHAFAQTLAAGPPDRLAHQLMTRMVVAVHQHIDRATPTRDGRANLKGSTQHEVTATGDYGVIRNANPIAVYVAQGTRPHVIVAKPGGVLRFEINGEVVFAKSVRHPGTKPNNFFAVGLSNAGPELAQILSDTGKQVVAWLFGARR